MAAVLIPKRAAVVTVALFGLLGMQATPDAMAGILGRGQGTQSVGSATFAVIPTLATSGTPLPAPAALAFTVATPRAFFDAVNTGSITLTAASYGLTLVYVGTGTPTVTLASCPGNAWNQTLNTCAVTPVTIGSWGAGSTSTTASSQVPVSPGDRLHLRASVTTTGLMTSATATANVSVSSGPTRQIRAAATSNS